MKYKIKRFLLKYISKCNLIRNNNENKLGRETDIIHTMKKYK